MVGLPRAFDEVWNAPGEAEDRAVGMVMDDDMARGGRQTTTGVRQDKTSTGRSDDDDGSYVQTKIKKLAMVVERLLRK